MAELFFAALCASFLWLPFRGGRGRALGAALAAIAAAAIAHVLGLPPAGSAVACALGGAAGWIGPGSGGPSHRVFGRPYEGPGGWGGSLGSGGFSGGFGGGGSGFGGSGASGDF
jgi:uncharacterized protein